MRWETKLHVKWVPGYWVFFASVLIFLQLAAPAVVNATNTVGDKTTSLTITINNNGNITTADTCTVSDLQNIAQTRINYSTIDNNNQPAFFPTEGVLLTDLLSQAHIDLNQVDKLTFTATDGYAQTFARDYLLDTPRYFYPGLKEGSLANAVTVDSLLALKSIDVSDVAQLDSASMDDYYSVRLFFGQTVDDQITNKGYVKWVKAIEVFTTPNGATPPVLTGDFNNNSIGQDVHITFTDDPAWRQAVSGITVDGISIPGQYSIAAGEIIIDANVFTSEKDYSIVVMANGYRDTSVIQHKGSWPQVFSLDGVINQQSYTLADLRRLPVTTFTYGPNTCRGVALKDLLSPYNFSDSTLLAQINVADATTYHINPVGIADLLNPADNYLLAYEIDGQPITIGAYNQTPLRIYWATGIVYKHVLGISLTKPVCLTLSSAACNPGDTVAISGTGPANTWISIKVLNPGGSVVYFDAVKTDASGSYTAAFKAPHTETGDLKVIAGYGKNIASRSLTLSGTGGDYCFIATACFGSKYAPSVALLRAFRDQYLLTNNSGQAFVRFYYQHSPPLAAYIAQHQMLRLGVRILLTPLIAAVYLLFHPGLFCSVVALVLLVMVGRRQKKQLYHLVNNSIN